MSITKIVSGGQTGADRGGLEAAIYCDIPHGGWCPKGRKAEDGPIPLKYNLKELKSADYLVRTEANAVDSDATVIFSEGTLAGGSRRTAQFAHKHAKPCLHIDVLNTKREEAVCSIVKWLDRDCPSRCVLNVAGSRGSKSPGLANLVKAWMIDVISAANTALFYPIAEEEIIHGDQNYGLHKVDCPAVKVRLDPAPPEEVPLYHPASIEEAVTTILDVISYAAKDMLKSISHEELSVSTHYGLGAAIRNCMIYRNTNQLDLLADYQRLCGTDEGKSANPDTVSHYILVRAWERLHEYLF